MSESLLNEREQAALKEILDLTVPYDLHVSWRDVKNYLRHGFQREKTIEDMVREAGKDKLMTMKLKLILQALIRCYPEEAAQKHDLKTIGALIVIP